MGLKINLLLVAIVFTVTLFLTGGKVIATVGGPTYISGIYYDPLSELIYYQKHDLGGQGCPAILHAIDLTNNTDSEVKSCVEVFEEFRINIDESGQKEYAKYIADFYKNLKYLSSVNLQKNKIDINVVSLEEHIEYGEKFWTDFRATVIQDGKEVSTLDFRGCDKEQPHIFEGYMIPNTDKIALLISNKGDCFEGGYIYESLNVINGIKYYDTNIVRYYKEASATEPNSGNLIIKAFVSSDIPVEPISDKKIPILALVGFLIFSVGIILGFVLGKITNRPVKMQSPDLTK